MGIRTSRYVNIAGRIVWLPNNHSSVQFCILQLQKRTYLAKCAVIMPSNKPNLSGIGNFFVSIALRGLSLKDEA